MIYVVYALIGVSLIFALAGVVGMLRFKDSYSRMQASTCIPTLGVLGVIIGGIIYSIGWLNDTSMAVKLAVLGLFYIVTNPISGHAIAKAAYRRGVRPDSEMVCDKYGEDLENDD